MELTTQLFGVLPDGREVTEYTMKAGALEVAVLDYGCIIHSIRIPDDSGNIVDVALGYDTLEGYRKGTCFHGAFVGRYANRIEGSHFALSGKEYFLAPNEGENHLHGTYCAQLFKACAVPDGIEFSLLSPDGEEGYPGNLQLTVRYTMRKDGTLSMEYEAVCDQDTPINLTNHCFFNLAGQGQGTVEDHVLWIGSGHFCEVRGDCCPTGQVLPVLGTPLDFTRPTQVGAGLHQPTKQMNLVGGYDHNFVLDQCGQGGHCASLACSRTGIQMDIYTTQPGLQFYAGNYLEQDIATGKSGCHYPKWGGLALETQHYPCSLSHPNFPSTILHKGEHLRETTTFHFQVEKQKPR